MPSLDATLSVTDPFSDSYSAPSGSMKSQRISLHRALSRRSSLLIGATKPWASIDSSSHTFAATSTSPEPCCCGEARIGRLPNARALATVVQIEREATFRIWLTRPSPLLPCCGPSASLRRKARRTG